ncbi:MAG: hypothetical protein A2144_05525 [Chloroflexi bacterium RBG_16_50_9]|nr:MAG: hypothetical protein A2144_05525 [Chloroflexi bacterium RBG_16_50_9]
MKLIIFDLDQTLVDFYIVALLYIVRLIKYQRSKLTVNRLSASLKQCQLTFYAIIKRSHPAGVSPFYENSKNQPAC